MVVCLILWRDDISAIANIVHAAKKPVDLFGGLSRLKGRLVLLSILLAATSHEIQLPLIHYAYTSLA